MGTMMLIALITAKRTWFYAPALLLSLIAVYRVLAWLVHDAALAMDMIIVELVVAVILLIAASKLSPNE
jgi:NhaP-type Na+/H+ or K+/H+ antiporter